MKKKSPNLLKNQTIIHITSTMAVIFLISASIIYFYFSKLNRDNQSKTISLATEKKIIELNTFFNTAENIVKEFQAYILGTLDEERLLTDSAYEEEYMQNLTDAMNAEKNMEFRLGLKVKEWKGRLFQECKVWDIQILMQ